MEETDTTPKGDGWMGGTQGLIRYGDKRPGGCATIIGIALDVHISTVQ